MKAEDKRREKANLEAHIQRMQDRLTEIGQSREAQDVQECISIKRRLAKGQAKVKDLSREISRLQIRETV